MDLRISALIGMFGAALYYIFKAIFLHWIPNINTDVASFGAIIIAVVAMLFFFLYLTSRVDNKKENDK